MKTVIVISALIAFAPCSAHGQAGYIGLFSDAPAYVWCDLVDISPALVPIYIVHKGCPGATASRFMVVTGGGFNMFYTGEIHHMPLTYGDSQTGVCIQYGTCYSGDFLLITICYFGQGLSETCSRADVVADPMSASGSIEVMDCAGNTLAATSGMMYINSDGSCSCGELPGEPARSTLIKPASAATPDDFCYPLPTRERTWGQVKALYE
jgi:hypothetical protein